MSESCGNPTVESEALMPKKIRFDRSTTCVKCKEQRGCLVIRHAVYCKDCFSALLPTRFRKALEPHINHAPDGPRRRALRPAGNLLLGVSGGLGSAVLLDVVHRTYTTRAVACDGVKGGREHPRGQKVWSTIRAAYVEVAGAFPGMKDRTEEVGEAVKRYEGIEFVPLRLEAAFDPAWWARVGQTSTADVSVDLNAEGTSLLADSPSASTPLDSLRNYLGRLPTPTAVQVAIAKLIRVLLLYTAHATSSSHVLLGTSLTSLSISLISSISQGGGFNVPQTMYEEWFPPGAERATESWRGEVRVIRPLRDVGTKECAAWAWWHALVVVGKERRPAAAQTIDGLTRDFIVGLEKDFPSTVSAISKTVGKLAPKGGTCGRCILCELPVQTDAHEWRARISIRTRSTQSDVPATLASSVALAPLFCYACHTTLTSRSSRSVAPTKASAPPPPPIVQLPVWAAAALSRLYSDTATEAEEIRTGGDRNVGEEVWKTRKLGEDEMRAAVGEFLFDT
ncbi:hypothetical protein K488DRAFT_48442 [Vararia minispora EC-137]|uniref:Uncharacterized protein n=1 Tax=Vararia minispora EC-137 TaxID=1314806 RepID=A0ACB8QNL9_9AGAM|nr:hypothetical protein K488DRAFT_48442 [Vararia minispora EC-137]